MAVSVIPGACQGCGACLITCPEHAITAAPGGPVISQSLCTGCGECEEICPVDAIAPDLAQARP
jgi:NAD-dependent dihydropyrimidine dehydrogenase PreA subunit